jgi:hypothetical protein
MSYIILRGRWGHVIVLNIYVPTQDKIEDIMDSSYEELEHVFDIFPKDHVTIFPAKLGREDVLNWRWE